MALTFKTDQDKLAALRSYYAAYGDSSAADRVAQRPGQAARAIADIEDNLTRSISKAKQALSVLAGAEAEKEKGKNVNVGSFKNQQKAEVLEWLQSVKKQIDTYGDYLDDTTKEEYNALASLGQDYYGEADIELLEGYEETAADKTALTKETSGGTTASASVKSTTSSKYPSYSSFSYISDPKERLKAFGAAVKEYKAAQGTGGAADTSTDKGYYLDTRNNRYFTANTGSPLVKDNPYIQEISATDFSAAANQGLVSASELMGATSSATASAATSSDIDRALALIENSDLPTDLKTLYSEVIKNWDPDAEIQPDTIIEKFQEIAKSTIDPYFAGLANLASKEVEDAATVLNKLRGIETETEDIEESEETKAARAALEESGLTFSGKAREALGEGSAFSTTAVPESLSTVPFGGTEVEGLLPKKYRLTRTSSEARYKSDLSDIGRGAEETLGSEAAEKLLSGYSAAGGVQGDITTKKQSAYGALLSSLFGQQADNYAQSQYLDYNFGE